MQGQPFDWPCIDHSRIFSSAASAKTQAARSILTVTEIRTDGRILPNPPGLGAPQTLKVCGVGPHQTNKPSFMGASAHFPRSRIASSDPRWTPGRCQQYAEHLCRVAVPQVSPRLPECPIRGLEGRSKCKIVATPLIFHGRAIRMQGGSPFFEASILHRPRRDIGNQRGFSRRSVNHAPFALARGLRVDCSFIDATLRQRGTVASPQNRQSRLR